MKSVSIINYKGGVGKTSLTANLGAELASRGKKVLLLDLDAQASLTFSFFSPDDWKNYLEQAKTIKSWFDSHEIGHPINLRSIVVRPLPVNVAIQNINSSGCLDLICSHLGLINVDLDLAVKLGGANIIQAKRNFINVHNRLSDGLRDANFTGYDIVLIDCPPNFNIVTKTAIVASDYILVPTRPDQLSVLGFDYLMRSIGQLTKDYNDYADVQSGDIVQKINPKSVGIVFNMIQEYGGIPIEAQRNFISQLALTAGVPIFSNYVKRNDSLFAGAPLYGVPVVLNRYYNDSHQSVVYGLEGVTNEFINAIGL